jgi:two-component system, OmpR family, sensor histidine kinase MprB
VTFRARVAIAAAVAVAVAVALASAAAYVIVREQLRLEVDRALEQRTASILAYPLASLQREQTRPWWNPPPLGGAGGYVQVVDRDGETFRPSGGDLALPAGDRVRAVAGGSGEAFLSDAHVDGVHVRIMTAPLAPGTAIQVARPLTEVDAVLERLRWILLLVALGGSALGATLGLVVSRASLRPVRRLTDAAEHIAATHDLTRRVDVDGEDELARLAASFNAMVAALSEAVRAQRRLVADASHELRTPLTSLRTNVDVLARADELTVDERAAALRDVREELEELSTLVGDLVELARDGEADALPEDVRLDLIVADALERARRRAPGIRFETELRGTFVRGVPDRLARAVANVLDNAVKWSPPGGVVEVRVRDGEVAIRDHGPGIEDADLPFVFDRFYRSAGARRLPGSGLGLAIVRRVAEANGGSATVERAEGGGTTVRIRLRELAWESDDAVPTAVRTDP